MSLEQDIKNVYVDTFGSEPVDGYAEGLSQAIIDWVQRQTFRIKGMKAYVELDQIKTTGDIQADVKESTIMGQYAPLIDIIEQIAGFVDKAGAVGIPGAAETAKQIRQPIDGMKKIAKTISKNGATVPALDMKREGGQGQTLVATGHAYIGREAEGRPDADTVDPENDYAEIELQEVLA